MTDTPAVVSLPFGLVLKCFLIFPATDSWCSFSHSPSSCVNQDRERKKWNRAHGKLSQPQAPASTLYLQSPMGALEPGGRCTFDRPQPPAWIESDPAVVNKHQSVLIGIAFRTKRCCCLLKWKNSPLPSLIRYPSMAGGILAVPLVSDQTALLDLHCSCNHVETMKWNHSSYKWSSCYTN